MRRIPRSEAPSRDDDRAKLALAIETELLGFRIAVDPSCTLLRTGAGCLASAGAACADEPEPIVRTEG
eukprot:scaffold157401_cov28-Tisochrysis_lutea.AAC.4